MKPVVSIAHRDVISESPAEYSEESLNVIRALVAESIYAACDFDSLVRNKTVLIKPNLVRPDLGALPAITTDPRVVIAMVELTQQAGVRKVAVGENPGYGMSSQFAFRAARLRSALTELGAEVCYFDEHEVVKVENHGARIFKNVLMPKPVLDADVFINVPKMKTHMHALVTLGIKNLHGLVYDEQRMLFHRQDVNHKMVDVLRIVQPSLTVIDGIWAAEGQAPLFGNVIKDFNLVISGTDIVAADAVASAVMGIAPHEVCMIRLAEKEGLGCANLSKIDVRGKKIEEVRRNFKRPVLSSAGVFDNIICLEGGACSGCLSSLRHALDKLSFEEKLQSLDCNTIYVGKPMPNITNIDSWDGDLWLFGNCSSDLVFSQVERRTVAKLVPGCPPHILDLYRHFCDTYSL